MTYIKHNGVWVQPTTYVKRNGVWVLAAPYVKHNGAWVAQNPADKTPPPIPTVSASVINGQYLNIGVRVGTTDVADLDTVRVLISGQGYPGSWYAAGRVNDIDRNYPEEIWSDWKYHNGVRNNSSLMTYKAYPPNANEGGAAILTSGTYYICAFAMDKTGNVSAAGQTTALIPYAPPPPPPVDNGGGDSGNGDDGNNPPPTTTQYTTEWEAKWSRSWYGNAVGTAHDGAVYSYGEHIRVGWWPDSGRMKAALGFPSYNIQNTLKGATIEKVEVHLRIGDCYYPKAKVRFRYHKVDFVPDTWDPNADIGTYQEWEVPEKQGAWFDITSHTANAWKTGDYRGLFFSPADDDLHRAIMFWGHQTQSPPRLRITYRK